MTLRKARISRRALRAASFGLFFGCCASTRARWIIGRMTSRCRTAIDRHRARRSLHGLLAFAIFLVYLLSSSWRFPLGGDGQATLATSRSLLTHRTLAIDAKFASDE